MNKLVSKNPVQRFKQGRKIVKAYRGEKVIATVGGKNLVVDIDQAKKNGWTYRTRTVQDLRMQHFGSQDAYNKFAKSQVIQPKKKTKTIVTEKGTTGNISTTPKNWNQEFTNNFTNTLTANQRAYLDSKMGVGKSIYNANDVQEFLLNQGATNLGTSGVNKNGVDGLWGDRSIKAWNNFLAQHQGEIDNMQNTAYFKPELETSKPQSWFTPLMAQTIPSTTANGSIPYSNWRNNLAASKNLVFDRGNLFKAEKGGQLISNNPIKRFKSEINFR